MKDEMIVHISRGSIMSVFAAVGKMTILDFYETTVCMNCDAAKSKHVRIIA